METPQILWISKKTGGLRCGAVVALSRHAGILPPPRPFVRKRSRQAPSRVLEPLGLQASAIVGPDAFGSCCAYSRMSAITDVLGK